MKKNNSIYYYVILSNGYTDLFLDFITKNSLPGFRSILFDLCYSNPSSDLYIFKKDLDIISEFLLNTFSISLTQENICLLKRICKTPFFVRIVKFKGVCNNEKQ